MSKLTYWNKADLFKRKILAIPERIVKANNNVDFSSGRYQEIMIDLESIIEDLESDFYLYCEDIEEDIKQWLKL